MEDMNTLKGELLQEIEKLPQDKLRKVLDFVGELLSQEQKSRTVQTETDMDPAQDPILGFIGGVSHGALAKDIDRDLYGE